jgi:predicted aldo/keto reductase-like oxidoreductase
MTTGSIEPQRRPFGSGKPVSLFTLGTMRALQSPGQLEAVVEAAIAAGINHLETAPAYGPSQRYVGQAIRRLGLSPEQLVITSKVLPGQSLVSAQDELRRSLEQLGLNRLDNLAVHGINRPQHLDWALQGPGQELLSWALEEKLVNQVGFSSHGSHALIAAAIRSGRFSFASLHLHLFDPGRLPLAQEALAKGMGVMAISPADKGGRLFDPPELLRQACAPFDPLSELEQAALERLHQQRQQRLGPEACGQCQACLPCPQQVPIPELLRLRNLAVGHGMESFAKERYGLIGQAGHWFEEINAAACQNCGDCLPRCPHHLAIPELLADTHQRLASPPRRRLWG